MPGTGPDRSAWWDVDIAGRPNHIRAGTARVGNSNGPWAPPSSLETVFCRGCDHVLTLENYDGVGFTLYAKHMGSKGGRK